MSAEGTYRREIDGLRALAVIPVVLYHAGFPAFGGGFVGVDVFFVISGYLITGLIRARIEAGEFTLVDFYERRFRRILPALCLVILAGLPAAWFWLFPRERQDFARSIVAVALFGSNIFFNDAIGYFAPNIEMWPLIHTWSLSVEEQFYFIYPLILWATRSWRARNVLALVVVITALSLALAQWMSNVDPQADFYLLPTRVWELGIGALIALSPSMVSRPTANIRAGLACAGLALLMASFLFISRALPLPSLLSLGPVGGAALLIAFATPANVVGRLLGSAPMVGVGLISYSAYLWHQPLFAFARYRFDVRPASLTMALLGVAAFALAFVSWRFVERPFRDRRLFSRTAIFTSALVVLVGLIVIGRVIVLHHGYPARMPAIVGDRDVGVYRDHCLDIADLSPASLAGLEACHLGVRGAKPDFLLVGDSHAASLADGVDLAAASAGRSGVVLGANACLPLVGVDSNYPRSKGACRRLHDAVPDIVEKLGVKLVILHARWDYLQESLTFEDNADRDAPVRERVRRRLIDTLSSLAVRGARIRIVTSTPTAPYRVPDILARKAYFGLDVDERATLAGYRATNALASILFADSAIRALAEPLDVYSFFCREPDASHCAVEEGGRPYFFDDSHLTGFESRALAPSLKGLFQ